MKLWKASLLVGLMTMGFQVWSWFLGLGWAAWSLIVSLSKMAGDALAAPGNRERAEAEAAEAEEERIRQSKLKPYSRSQYMPDIGGDRPERTRYGTSPLMGYLDKFTRTR